MQKYHIGVFDSGFGGLTILNEFQKLLPEYSYLYLGDNARSPYGSRSFETVYKYTLDAVKKLFEMDCFLIILACNTASAKALRTIQQTYLPLHFPDRRVLGVIRPTSENIHHETKNNHIGILGTIGTINSNSYIIEINKLHPQISISQQACPMWVPIIENGEALSNGADYFVSKYINMLMETDPLIDTIVLGCTHYPILIPKIKEVINPNISIVNQSSIVAKSLKTYLKNHPEIESKLNKDSYCKYYTTETPETFDKTAEIFIGNQIKSNKIDI